ncbi:MAG: hypothetical protein H5T98_03975 [Syntrophomonadaceae bacterium]|nr:hypothetical protein [Syntrophomonadaceae bacterium]
MSKVIKGANFLLSKPRMVGILCNCEDLAPVGQAGYEKEEVERLKNECEKILNETERMAAELIAKAKEEAEALIASAQEEADAIRTQVYEEAEKIKGKAKEEGYSEGVKAAREEAEAERQLVLQERRDILEEARKTKVAMMRSSEADIVSLAVAIAKKVIATELSINPEIIVNVLQEALDFIDHPKNVTVYVNPQDLEELLEALQSDAFSRIGSGSVSMDVRADKRISPGGCIVESETGAVDARLECRMAGVEKAVKEVAANG